MIIALKYACHFVFYFKPENLRENLQKPLTLKIMKEPKITQTKSGGVE